MASSEDSKKRKTPEFSVPVLSKDLMKRVTGLLGQDKLVEILAEAGFLHEQVRQSILGEVNKNPANRKIFVRSLGPDTTTKSLKEAFIEYGPIEEGKVITDKQTQQTRGFGFIIFNDIYSCMRALSDVGKTVDGHVVNSQLATISTMAIQSGEISERKIYVGNVPFMLSADRVHSFFSKYGEIEEGPLGYEKGVSRGYALILYKNVESARLALQEPIKVIDGHQVNCKKAIDKHKTPSLIPDQTPATAIQTPAPGSLPQPLPAPQPVAPVLAQPPPQPGAYPGLVYGTQPYPQAPVYPALKPSQVYYTQTGEMMVSPTLMPSNPQQPLQYAAPPTAAYGTAPISVAPVPAQPLNPPSSQLPLLPTPEAPSSTSQRVSNPSSHQGSGLPSTIPKVQDLQQQQYPHQITQYPSTRVGTDQTQVPGGTYIVSQGPHPSSNPVIVYPQKHG